MANRSALLMKPDFFFSQDNWALNRPISAYNSLSCFSCSASLALLALAFIFKQLVEIFQRLLLPFVDLVRMDTVFRGDLGYAFVFLQRFQHDLCLLAGGYSFSFLGIVSLQKVHLNYARFRV